MSGLKLFWMTKGGMTEVVPRLADTETDVQSLVESNMQELHVHAPRSTTA